MARRLLGGLGALATLGAVAVLVRPDLADALPGVAGLLESQGIERVLLALGAAVGTYAAWAARGGSSGRPPTDEPSVRFSDAGDPPEAVGATHRTRTGEGFDARVRAACDGDDRALGRVRDALADTAADALARSDALARADDDRERAERAVETGAWTDDRIAAAFLADESGPSFPLSARLRAWLDAEAERRRRIERTVEAVEGLLDGDGPDPDGSSGGDPDPDGSSGGGDR